VRQPQKAESSIAQQLAESALITLAAYNQARDCRMTAMERLHGVDRRYLLAAAVGVTAIGAGIYLRKHRRQTKVSTLPWATCAQHLQISLLGNRRVLF